MKKSKKFKIQEYFSTQIVCYGANYSRMNPASQRRPF